jgi:hypothetical protein
MTKARIEFLQSQLNHFIKYDSVKTAPKAEALEAVQDLVDEIHDLQKIANNAEWARNPDRMGK